LLFFCILFCGLSACALTFLDFFFSDPFLLKFNNLSNNPRSSS
jgi:hypothetical protein